MFTGVQFTHFIQANPALAVFLTVALGFLLGKLRIRSFSLGTVTSVLLGELNKITDNKLTTTYKSRS